MGEKETECCKNKVEMAFLSAVRLSALRSLRQSWRGGTLEVSHSVRRIPQLQQVRGLGQLMPLQARTSVQTIGGAGEKSQALSEKKVYRLSPSDFAFLWKECKRCFYLKAHGLLYRPRFPFPSIFNKIDLSMKDFFSAKRTESVLPNMPRGEFLCEEEDAWVESEVLDLDRESMIFIRGKIDCLLLNDDQTYSIIDFKTSDIDRHLQTYSRQLHAYALALEHPSKNCELIGNKVSHMGLVVYEPSKFGFSNVANEKGENAVANLTGYCKYHPIRRDDAQFTSFLHEVLDVLEGGLPGHTSDCPCCSYLRSAEKHGYSRP
eukprot:Plantae.Rhodophyta-Purpureofilum_apyrenoidigerum.ctg9417.p1 GENE.Plantae.Rhodophyta-Purpureofilum_apyrenoidigerum.ctg9417~~Plantae.Rhodophyta-Purpureofilum_apyrenoidigerum.ctg9417.p1  ORF type:complete len:319 (-),score=44.70 Plantae.Rhodophyta-Purpureofilum_apyrenoidigerum.ctg9417:189-1145(-)